MMLRIAAAVIITVIGGGIGHMKAESLKLKKRRCTAINSLLQWTMYYVGSRRDDVYSICRGLKNDDDMKILGFLGDLPDRYECGCDFRGIWQDAVNNDRALDEDERDILLRFGAIFGKSDCLTQQEAIGGLQKELEVIAAERRDDLMKKGRLYRAAGLLFGVMAGIIVI